MKDLCIAFLESSVATWNFLKRAAEIGYQPGEETITDLLLLEWQDELAPELISIAHNKNRESVTGADWEWWFLGRTRRALGLRVQAKIVRLESSRYEHLHAFKNRRKPPRHEYQCDVLIAASRSEPPERLPIYCLYSWWKAGTEHRLGIASKGEFTTAYGCSLLSVNAVRHLRRNARERNVASVKPHLFPLHAIVCPDALSAEIDLSDLIRERLVAMINEADEHSDMHITREDTLFDYRSVQPSQVMPE